ncbi:hypothetical protein HJC23_000690 [Cyclotella cryptica]|uniref:Methyltransferase n=1 Tax=Cyclotella cryptica TaxID=29204 RepID=A0ABD3QA48_9STRA
MGVSPTLWTHMVRHWGIKSVLDVGCGRGISTAWFITHGLEFVQCVEGSHDAVLQSIVPNSTLTATAITTTTTRKKFPENRTVEYPRVVEHDFSLGPWWPPRTIDCRVSMTDEARAMAMQDSSRRDLTRHMTEDYMYFVGQHLWLSLQVFINLMVASLPRHSHLFAEHGCFGGRNDGEKIHKFL